MYELNEEYLISILKEQKIPTATINKIISELVGCRIYIRKKSSEYKRIISLYEKMKKAHIRDKEIISYISKVENKSKQRIREILSAYSLTND